MADEKFENIECVCAFVNAISGYKEALMGFLDIAITFLQTSKGLIALVPADFGDYRRSKELEAELAVLEAGLSVVGGPLGLLRAYAQPWADCPPVDTLVTAVNKFYNMAISDITEKQFEVEQQLRDIDLEGIRVQQIDNWLGILEDFKDAIAYCEQINTSYTTTS